MQFGAFGRLWEHLGTFFVVVLETFGANAHFETCTLKRGFLCLRCPFWTRKIDPRGPEESAEHSKIDLEAAERGLSIRTENAAGDPKAFNFGLELLYVLQNVGRLCLRSCELCLLRTQICL